MSSIFLVIFGLIGFSFGWFVYSKFIAEKIYKLDPNYVTPAHQFNDGIDFVPTNKYVLWGAHFTAVAGAAPIIGPAVAVYWGWVPALLWVTFGSIFFAGVHDMGALWARTIFEWLGVRIPCHDLRRARANVWVCMCARTRVQQATN